MIIMIRDAVTVLIRNGALLLQANEDRPPPRPPLEQQPLAEGQALIRGDGEWARQGRDG